MNKPKESTFEWVYRTPLGELTAMSFGELQKLQQQIMSEIKRAKLAKRWIEGAINKKRQDQAKAEE